MSDARWTNCQNKVLAILGAVFVAGFASGGVAMHIFDGDKLIAAVETELSPEEVYQQQSLVAVEELEAQLDLDPEQSRRVKTILDECIMAEADLLMKVRNVQHKGRQRIMEVLRPEQRVQFEAVFQPVSSR